MSTGTNPLYAQQREYSGAQTFHKYLYQYNWAIFTIFDFYKNDSQYVVFPELHEDIVIGNSIEFDEVLFDFNQVKCIETGEKYSLADLVYKSPSKKTSSILGKLLESNNSHKYSSRIKNLNLVASCGYNFKIKDGTKISKININDINDTEGYKDKLINEMSIEELPDNLNFIDPELPPTTQRYAVIGRISDVLNEKHPKSNFNATTIYQAVFDEICKKGEKACDYKDWDEAIDKKAISSEKINKLIKDVVISPSLDTTQINDFLDELNLKARTRVKYHNRFRDILISNSTTSQKNIFLENNFKPIFDKGYDLIEDTDELISYMKINSPEELFEQFIDEIDFQCTVIFYIIERLNNER